MKRDEDKKLNNVVAIAGVIFIVLFTIFFLSGCGKKEQTLKEVKIGYFNNITHAQALYMKANGLLEKELGDDVSVTWTSFNAGPAEVEALFAEDIDIGFIGPVPAVTANVKSKGDVQILAGASRGGAIIVKRAGSDISSVKDLEGKNISIPQIGNTQHLCLLNLLKENGLAPDTDGGNVTVSAIANADVQNVMERGDIDASIVPEPWGATLLSKGAELVADYDEIYMGGDYDVAVVVVRKDFYEKHPEVVEAFLKTHKAVTETLKTDTDNAMTTVNTEIEAATGKLIGAEILKNASERIIFDDKCNEDSINGFAKISLEQKFINELPADGLFIK